MYRDFASVYDRLMQDVPYLGWIEYLGRLFERHGIKPADVLDIGCGTGNITIPLAEMGYRIAGLDMSGEMLALAEEKARSQGLRISWIQQDMRFMDLGIMVFDLIISMTDSLNYIAGPADLLQVFQRVHGMLKTGGWFVFDLNSAYKLKKVFGNNVFTLLEEDIAYIWENTFDHESRRCVMDLTFFAREADGRYRRFEEQHAETAFETGEVRGILLEAGFKVEAVYAENSMLPPDETTERIYFLARKG